jgi:hypothetical protein
MRELNRHWSTAFEIDGFSRKPGKRWGIQSCDPAGTLRLLLRDRVPGPCEDLGQHMPVHLFWLFDPI